MHAHRSKNIVMVYYVMPIIMSNLQIYCPL